MRQHPFRAALVGVFLLVALVPAQAGPALLFEADSGRVYYAEDADDHWYPASLTKILTAYVTFAALKAGKVTLDTKIKCSEAANMQPPSKLGLPVGGEITIDLALRSLIVKSANDVAVMLAEGVAGSEEAFVAEMNAVAKRLGMTRSNFVNPNGLPAAEQVTTARDLAILSKAVLRDFPEYAEYWTMVDVRIGKRRLGSHNGLLRTYEGADGLKTGFICDAGYNVVASATRDGRRLMAVVLGEPSGFERSIRAASLLDHGFTVQGWKQVLNPKTLETMPRGAEARGPVSVRDDVITWDCGGRARKRVVAKARDQKRVAAKKAKAAAADAPAGDGAAKPPAATKTAGDAAPAKPKTKAAAAPADAKQ
ncbi:MAG: D-alanyl-D-alanine carboxypeptidase family protein [Hyphomicrobiaceae bacterium]